SARVGRFSAAARGWLRCRSGGLGDPSTRRGAVCIDRQTPRGLREWPILEPPRSRFTSLIGDIAASTSAGEGVEPSCPLRGHPIGSARLVDFVSRPWEAGLCRSRGLRRVALYSRETLKGG